MIILSDKSLKVTDLFVNGYKLTQTRTLVSADPNQKSGKTIWLTKGDSVEEFNFLYEELKDLDYVLDLFNT